MNNNISKYLNIIVSYVIPISVILYSIYFMILNGSIYAIAPVPYTHEYVHSFSLSCFMLSFIVFQRAMKHIPIVMRIIVSILLISIHGYFGGFLWDANNLIVNGIYNIMIFIDITIVVWFCFFILHLNKKYPILKKHPSNKDIIGTTILFIMQSLGYILLYINGFWRYFSIGAIIDIPDPNANIFWLFMRISSFFLFYFFLEKGQTENYSMEAPRF
jgi:hypothetical protein